MSKYDLHLLGWYAFQQLCLTVVREKLGQTVEAFLDTNDAGKDGAFSGVWKQESGEANQGKFVIQCKFTNQRDQKLQMSQLTDEFEKIEKLIAEGVCDVYVLMTNAGVSGRFDTLFKKRMQELGAKHSLIFGSDWICSQIKESKRLRSLVPRIYGLGDLSQILDERAYAQANQLLASMRDDLAKIVITSAYFKAVKALNEHGYVLIIGEPAAGKTTIASLLAMAAVDQWKAFTLKLDQPKDVVTHWNPEDPNQFVWIDDAFGVTQYESDLVKNWNHILPQVKTMLKQGIKIVMTSRDYIYKRARNDIKEGAFPLFNESQVVIDVHKLTNPEKQQILYNHLKLGRQSRAFKTKLKPFLNAAAEHPQFIPETARRLADPAFTTNLYVSEYYVLEFVNKQESFLEDVLRSLDKHSKAALGLIYMNNGQLISPLELRKNEVEAVNKLGSNVGDCIEALNAMKESLVQYIILDDNAFWRYKHPTIGDAYTNILANSPEQLEIYLQGTDIEKIMDQVTCGNVGLEKAIVVPKAMYSMVMNRISVLRSSSSHKTEFLSQWDAKRKVLSFLSRRSSRVFLEMYLASNPRLLELIIKPPLAFHYSEEIELVIKLHKENLLPDTHRKIFVDYVGSYTITGDDLYLLKNDEMQGLFTENELVNIKLQVESLLIPRLSQVRENREKEFREYNDDTSEEHMDDFLEKTNALLEEFEGNEAIEKLIEVEIQHAKNWIDENMFEDNNNRTERILDSTDDATTIASKRSIFDDIDM